MFAARLNITAEFGKDKCTSEIFDVATNKDRAGICPRDDRMMVIRYLNKAKVVARALNVSVLEDTRFDLGKKCKRQWSKFNIYRAINETGARVTFDNDVTNVREFLF